MRIIVEGELKHISAVIGICGVNFCSFVSDGRLVVNDSNGGLIKVGDKIQKVFKVNNNLLFGGAGWFERNEEILDPLGSSEKAASMSPDQAYANVIQYLSDCVHDIHLARSYLNGGKSESGFLIYEIRINPVSHTVESTVCKPTPPSSNFGFSCCLPFKAAQRQNEILSLIEKSIVTSTRHDEMIKKIGGVIGHISTLDDSVGTNIMAVSVF